MNHKELLYSVVTKKVIARAVSLLPMLGFPLVNPVFVFFAEKLLTLLYEELEKEGQITFIELKTDMAQKQYQKAVEDLKIAVEKGNQQEVELAKKEFKDKVHNLISFNS